MSALDEVLGRLKNVRQEGEEHRASCPVPTHGQGRGDVDPSLRIGSDAEGNVLLKCFVGCDTASIVEALNLKMGDLYEHHNGSR